MSEEMKEQARMFAEELRSVREFKIAHQQLLHAAIDLNGFLPDVTDWVLDMEHDLYKDHVKLIPETIKALQSIKNKFDAMGAYE
jgi:hypothetical protein